MIKDIKDIIFHEDDSTSPTLMEVSYEELSRDDAIKLAVTQAMGEDSYVEHENILNSLGITVYIGPKLTSKSLKKEALTGSLEIAELLIGNSLTEDLITIFITFEAEAVDIYGNKGPATVIEIGYDVEILQKINFDEVKYQNVPKIAGYYWESDVFN